MEPDYFFCPRPTCPNHRLDLHCSDWFVHHGYHDTIAFGRVPRYRCKHCGKTFSDQTFLLNYWLKRKTDFAALGKEYNSSSSDNFVARHLHLSADSIRIRHDRLARNALFLQAFLTRSLSINEPLVADGLESYVLNQFFPVNLNILIGQHSQFVYYFTESHSKRKGSMTDQQRKKIDTVYLDKSFKHSGISVMFRRLLGYLDGRCASSTITLNTDEHPIYPRVIERWNHQRGKHPGRPRIRHLQTSSKEPRTRNNPLFSANYLERLLRKDMPNHRRETICQARNDRNLLSRLSYYLVTHNFFKPYRIGSGAKQTTRLHTDGVIAHRTQLETWKRRMHTYRFFRSFVELPRYSEEIWCKRTATPLKTESDPTPDFAYQ